MFPSTSTPTSVQPTTTNQPTQIIVPLSALGPILTGLTANRQHQAQPVLSTVPTTAVTQQIPAVLNASTAGQPILTSLVTDSQLQAPAISQNQTQQQQLLNSLLNPSAAGLNPVVTSALVNSSTANLISQLASSVSGILLSLAQKANNKTGQQEYSKEAREVIQLLTTMTNLAANLNTSVSSLLASNAASNRVLTLKVIPQATAEQKPAGPSTTDGTLKNLLTKTAVQPGQLGDSEEENIPQGATSKRKLSIAPEKRPAKAPRRLLANSDNTSA